MWRMFMILGVLAFFVGTGLVCPAIAELIRLGEGGALSITLLILGTAVTLGGLWSFAHEVKKLRAGTS